MFHDRIEAGLALAEELKKYKNDPVLILAIPRGGVPVAYVVARELGFPLDILLTKKIGHPANKEYAIGAASLTDSYIVPHPHVSEKYTEGQIIRIREKLQDMYKKFMGDKEPEDIKGKTLIVIDDGIATGNTLTTTINMLRKEKPGKIVIAVPVASPASLQRLSQEVDEVICLWVAESFPGVGAFYEDFSQVSDEDVVYYLSKLDGEKKKKAD
ncbi:MAG: phosphoribosyltransferase [Chitinophagaceae bacterium]|jgi:predicted phosphoribosyltransferase|nr:MAG: phosphoribosyltransferase [Chitinophagaceae bacterium]